MFASSAIKLLKLELTSLNLGLKPLLFLEISTSKNSNDLFTFFFLVNFMFVYFVFKN